MPLIHVVKPFMLKDDDHKLTEYKVGRYEVTDEVASHWYVQAHLEGFVDPPPKAGTDQLRVLMAEQAARVAEPVQDQTQPPAVAPATAKPEFAFAGRRRNVPRNVEPGMTSFIDPKTV